MDMNEELLLRLKDHEDGFTERKVEGAGNNKDELRKTLVAFANSVPEGKTAILFIGFDNDGTPTGISSSDSLQKKIREVAEQDCFPSIEYQTRVFECEGKTLLAVCVEASKDRPHFAGPAYVRKGSESVKASKQVYDELIASRNTKAGKILRSKDQLITFCCFELDTWQRQRQCFEIECRIEACDGHVVSLLNAASGRHFSVPLDLTTISHDHSRRRLRLEAPSGLWLAQSGI